MKDCQKRAALNSLLKTGALAEGSDTGHAGSTGAKELKEGASVRPRLRPPPSQWPNNVNQEDEEGGGRGRNIPRRRECNWDADPKPPVSEATENERGQGWDTSD